MTFTDFENRPLVEWDEGRTFNWDALKENDKIVHWKQWDRLEGLLQKMGARNANRLSWIQWRTLEFKRVAKKMYSEFHLQNSAATPRSALSHSENISVTSKGHHFTLRAVIPFPEHFCYCH